MKTYTHPRLIWPTERIPLDFTFMLDPGDSIATYQNTVYDVTDDSKTDLSPTIVDIGGVSRSGIDADIVRLAIHNMTLGKTYHFATEAETLLGRTHTQAILVSCGYGSISMPVFPYASSKRYTLHFDDRLPSPVTLTDSDSDCTAYVDSDLSTNIWATLASQILVDGQKATIDLENFNKNTTNIVNVLLTTSIDAVTNTTYLIGERMVIPCREL